MKGKRFAALALALALLIGLWGPSVLTADAEEDSTVYVRKHVSMLYDDSGSMSSTKVENNLKWTFASYAAQSFAGLLNDTDTLTITFMNHSDERADQLTVDLQTDRAGQVANVMAATGTVFKQGNTPLDQVDTALQVLLDEGLGQTGSGQSEQYWLVLMTDGIFTDAAGNELAEETVLEKFTSLLEAYPQLQLVYFGIGAEGQSGSAPAKDFREEPRLTAYGNFSAVYAPNQDMVVSTMQTLSSRISGRYDVTDSARISGTTVTMEISGEASPIRNAAVLAQNTNATLVSAVAEDGTALEITRSAALNYPTDGRCANVPEGTLGGYTALISGSNGERIPSGSVTLTFSEPVEKTSLSLMYEPAIHLNLTVEKKLASSEWESLGSSALLSAGDTIRINYAVCEDGSNEPLDVSAFYGETKTSITANGQTIQAGEEFRIAEGDTAIRVDISMMDGSYEISTSRTLKAAVITGADFQVTSSGAISLNRAELAENTEKWIDFTVLYGGAAAEQGLLEQFTCTAAGESGEALDGAVSLPGEGVVRFTPRDEDAEADSYTVSLSFDGETVCRELITVNPDLYYTATASDGFSVMDNEIAACTDRVEFLVTAHEDGEERPITREEAALFRITSASESGGSLDWSTTYQDGGLLALVPAGSDAEAGIYTVSLVEQESGEVLGTATVSVMKHDAVYSVEAILPENPSVNLFRLDYNETAVGFRVYMDGQLCTAAQLQEMVDNQVLTAEADRSDALLSLVVTVDELDGAPVVLCTPTSGAKGHIAAFWQRIPIAYGGIGAGEMTITLTVDQPKGAEGLGTLQLYGSLLWRIFYLVLPWLILLAAAVIGMLIYSNLRMPRFKNGVLTHVELTLATAGQYAVGIAETAPTHSRRFYLNKLLPLPQRITFKGITFEARPSHVKRGKKRFCDPTALISGTAAEINKEYCSNLPNPLFLQNLTFVLSGGQVAKRNVPLTDVAPFDPAMVGDMNAQQTWKPALADGAYLVKKQFNGKKLEGMEIWGFLEKH